MSDEVQTVAPKIVPEDRLPAIEYIIKVNNPEYLKEAEELYKSMQELITSDTAKKATELDPNLAFRVSLVTRDSGAGAADGEEQRVVQLF